MMSGNSRHRGPPILFTEAFRVFFLSAAVYGIVSMVIWLGWLGVHAAGGAFAALPFAPAPHQWHAHEMVFGYGTAALAGFFLTAVPNWTGSPPSRAAFIAALFTVWLVGRLAVFFSASLSASLVMAVDMAFIPILSWKVLSNLLKRPKPQNMMFVGLLTLMLASNLAVHLDWLGRFEGIAEAGLLSGLLTLAAMIAVLGGRVTPAFTRNALQRNGGDVELPVSRTLFEVTGVASAVLLPLLVLFSLDDWLLAGVAAMAALANGARLAGWRGDAVLGQPILWSLHLGYLMLVLGYAALTLHWSGFEIGRAAAVHLLAIGAVGGMTLAVMSRAALGHTGRPLIAPSPVVVAYVLVAVAAVLRSVGVTVVPQHYYAVLFLSGGLWVMAFAMFVAVYAPIVRTPRVDETMRAQ